MKRIKTTWAWILFCYILAVTNASPGHRTHMPPEHQPGGHQRSFLSGLPPHIRFAENKSSHLQEVSCVSADINIFDILAEAKRNCKGNDYHVKFYFYYNQKYYHIGEIDIDKDLFDQTLMKYDHWLITGEQIRVKDPLQNLPDDIIELLHARDKNAGEIATDHDNTAGLNDEDDIFVLKKTDLPVNNDDHDIPALNTVNNGSVQDTVNPSAESKDKDGHYLKLKPNYDHENKSFEVFLPKDGFEGKERTINVEIDPEKQKPSNDSNTETKFFEEENETDSSKNTSKPFDELNPPQHTQDNKTQNNFNHQNQTTEIDLNSLTPDDKSHISEILHHDPKENTYNNHENIFEDHMAPKTVQINGENPYIYNPHDFDDSHEIVLHDKEKHVHLNEQVYKINGSRRDGDHESAPYVFKLPKAFSVYQQPLVDNTVHEDPTKTDKPTEPGDATSNLWIKPINNLDLDEFSKTVKPEKDSPEKDVSKYFNESYTDKSPLDLNEQAPSSITHTSRSHDYPIERIKSLEPELENTPNQHDSSPLYTQNVPKSDNLEHLETADVTPSASNRMGERKPEYTCYRVPDRDLIASHKPVFGDDYSGASQQDLVSSMPQHFSGDSFNPQQFVTGKGTSASMGPCVGFAPPCINPNIEFLKLPTASPKDIYIQNVCNPDIQNPCVLNPKFVQPYSPQICPPPLHPSHYEEVNPLSLAAQELKPCSQPPNPFWNNPRQYICPDNVSPSVPLLHPQGYSPQPIGIPQYQNPCVPSPLATPLPIVPHDMLEPPLINSGPIFDGPYKPCFVNPSQPLPSQRPMSLAEISPARPCSPEYGPPCFSVPTEREKAHQKLIPCNNVPGTLIANAQVNTQVHPNYLDSSLLAPSLNNIIKYGPDSQVATGITKQIPQNLKPSPYLPNSIQAQDVLDHSLLPPSISPYLQPEMTLPNQGIPIYDCHTQAPNAFENIHQQPLPPTSYPPKLITPSKVPQFLQPCENILDHSLAPASPVPCQSPKPALKSNILPYDFSKQFSPLHQRPMVQFPKLANYKVLSPEYLDSLLSPCGHLAKTMPYSEAGLPNFAKQFSPLLPKPKFFNPSKIPCQSHSEFSPWSANILPPGQNTAAKPQPAMFNKPQFATNSELLELNDYINHQQPLSPKPMPLAPCQMSNFKEGTPQNYIETPLSPCFTPSPQWPANIPSPCTQELKSQPIPCQPYASYSQISEPVNQPIPCPKPMSFSPNKLPSFRPSEYLDSSLTPPGLPRLTPEMKTLPCQDLLDFSKAVLNPSLSQYRPLPNMQGPVPGHNYLESPFLPGLSSYSPSDFIRLPAQSLSPNAPNINFKEVLPSPYSDNILSPSSVLTPCSSPDKIPANFQGLPQYPSENQISESADYHRQRPLNLKSIQSSEIPKYMELSNLKYLDDSLLQSNRFLPWSAERQPMYSIQNTPQYLPDHNIGIQDHINHEILRPKAAQLKPCKLQPGLNSDLELKDHIQNTPQYLTDHNIGLIDYLDNESNLFSQKPNKYYPYNKQLKRQEVIEADVVENEEFNIPCDTKATKKPLIPVEYAEKGKGPSPCPQQLSPLEICEELSLRPELANYNTQSLANAFPCSFAPKKLPSNIGTLSPNYMSPDFDINSSPPFSAGFNLARPEYLPSDRHILPAYTPTICSESVSNVESYSPYSPSFQLPSPLISPSLRPLDWSKIPPTYPICGLPPSFIPTNVISPANTWKEGIPYNLQGPLTLANDMSIVPSDYLTSPETFINSQGIPLSPKLIKPSYMPQQMPVPLLPCRETTSYIPISSPTLKPLTPSPYIPGLSPYDSVPQHYLSPTNNVPQSPFATNEGSLIPCNAPCFIDTTEKALPIGPLSGQNQNGPPQHFIKPTAKPQGNNKEFVTVPHDNEILPPHLTKLSLDNILEAELNTQQVPSSAKPNDLLSVNNVFQSNIYPYAPNKEKQNKNLKLVPLPGKILSGKELTPIESELLDLELASENKILHPKPGSKVNQNLHNVDYSPCSEDFPSNLVDISKSGARPCSEKAKIALSIDKSMIHDDTYRNFDLIGESIANLPDLKHIENEIAIDKYTTIESGVKPLNQKLVNGNYVEISDESLAHSPLKPDKINILPSSLAGTSIYDLQDVPSSNILPLASNIEATYATASIDRKQVTPFKNTILSSVLLPPSLSELKGLSSAEHISKEFIPHDNFEILDSSLHGQSLPIIPTTSKYTTSSIDRYMPYEALPQNFISPKDYHKDKSYQTLESHPYQQIPYSSDQILSQSELSRPLSHSPYQEGASPYSTIDRHSLKGIEYLDSSLVPPSINDLRPLETSPYTPTPFRPESIDTSKYILQAENVLPSNDYLSKMQPLSNVNYLPQNVPAQYFASNVNVGTVPDYKPINMQQHGKDTLRPIAPMTELSNYYNSQDVHPNSQAIKPVCNSYRPMQSSEAPVFASSSYQNLKPILAEGTPLSYQPSDRLSISPCTFEKSTILTSSYAPLIALEMRPQEGLYSSEYLPLRPIPKFEPPLFSPPHMMAPLENYKYIDTPSPLTMIPLQQSALPVDYIKDSGLTLSNYQTLGMSDIQLAPIPCSSSARLVPPISIAPEYLKLVIPMVNGIAVSDKLEYLPCTGPDFIPLRPAPSRPLYTSLTTPICPCMSQIATSVPITLQPIPQSPIYDPASNIIPAIPSQPLYSSPISLTSNLVPVAPSLSLQPLAPSPQYATLLPYSPPLQPCHTKAQSLGILKPLGSFSKLPFSVGFKPILPETIPISPCSTLPFAPLKKPQFPGKFSPISPAYTTLLSESAPILPLSITPFTPPTTGHPLLVKPSPISPCYMTPLPPSTIPSSLKLIPITAPCIPSQISPILPCPGHTVPSKYINLAPISESMTYPLPSSTYKPSPVIPCSLSPYIQLPTNIKRPPSMSFTTPFATTNVQSNVVPQNYLPMPAEYVNAVSSENSFMQPQKYKLLPYTPSEFIPQPKAILKPCDQPTEYTPLAANMQAMNQILQPASQKPEFIKYSPQPMVLLPPAKHIKPEFLPVNEAIFATENICHEIAESKKELTKESKIPTADNHVEFIDDIEAIINGNIPKTFKPINSVPIPNEQILKPCSLAPTKLLTVTSPHPYQNVPLIPVLNLPHFTPSNLVSPSVYHPYSNIEFLSNFLDYPYNMTPIDIRQIPRLKPIPLASYQEMINEEGPLHAKFSNLISQVPECRPVEVTPEFVPSYLPSPLPKYSPYSPIAPEFIPIAPIPAFVPVSPYSIPVLPSPKPCSTISSEYTSIPFESLPSGLPSPSYSPSPVKYLDAIPITQPSTPEKFITPIPGDNIPFSSYPCKQLPTTPQSFKPTSIPPDVLKAMNSFSRPYSSPQFTISDRVIPFDNLKPAQYLPPSPSQYLTPFSYNNGIPSNAYGPRPIEAVPEEIPCMLPLPCALTAQDTSKEIKPSFTKPLVSESLVSQEYLDSLPAPKTILPGSPITAEKAQFATIPKPCSEYRPVELPKDLKQMIENISKPKVPCSNNFLEQTPIQPILETSSSSSMAEYLPMSSSKGISSNGPCPELLPIAAEALPISFSSISKPGPCSELLPIAAKSIPMTSSTISNNEPCQELKPSAAKFLPISSTVIPLAGPCPQLLPLADKSLTLTSLSVSNIEPCPQLLPLAAETLPITSTEALPIPVSSISKAEPCPQLLPLAAKSIPIPPTSIPFTRPCPELLPLSKSIPITSSSVSNTGPCSELFPLPAKSLPIPLSSFSNIGPCPQLLPLAAEAVPIPSSSISNIRPCPELLPLAAETLPITSTEALPIPSLSISKAGPCPQLLPLPVKSLPIPSLSVSNIGPCPQLPPIAAIPIAAESLPITSSSISKTRPCSELLPIAVESLPISSLTTSNKGPCPQLLPLPTKSLPIPSTGIPLTGPCPELLPIAAEALPVTSSSISNTVPCPELLPIAVKSIPIPLSSTSNTGPCPELLPLAAKSLPITSTEGLPIPSLSVLNIRPCQELLPLAESRPVALSSISKTGPYQEILPITAEVLPIPLSSIPKARPCPELLPLAAESLPIPSTGIPLTGPCAKLLPISDNNLQYANKPSLPQYTIANLPCGTPKPSFDTSKVPSLLSTSSKPNYISVSESSNINSIIPTSEYTDISESSLPKLIPITPCASPLNKTVQVPVLSQYSSYIPYSDLPNAKPAFNIAQGIPIPLAPRPTFVPKWFTSPCLPIENINQINSLKPLPKSLQGPKLINAKFEDTTNILASKNIEYDSSALPAEYVNIKPSIPLAKQKPTSSPLVYEELISPNIPENKYLENITFSPCLSPSSPISYAPMIPESLTLAEEAIPTSSLPKPKLIQPSKLIPVCPHISPSTTSPCSYIPITSEKIPLPISSASQYKLIPPCNQYTTSSVPLNISPMSYSSSAYVSDIQKLKPIPCLPISSISAIPLDTSIPLQSTSYLSPISLTDTQKLTLIPISPASSTINQVSYTEMPLSITESNYVLPTSNLNTLRPCEVTPQITPINNVIPILAGLDKVKIIQAPKYAPLQPCEDIKYVEGEYVQPAPSISKPSAILSYAPCVPSEIKNIPVASNVEVLPSSPLKPQLSNTITSEFTSPYTFLPTPPVSTKPSQSNIPSNVISSTYIESPITTKYMQPKTISERPLVPSVISPETLPLLPCQTPLLAKPENWSSVTNIAKSIPCISQPISWSQNVPNVPCVVPNIIHPCEENLFATYDNNKPSTRIMTKEYETTIAEEITEVKENKTVINTSNYTEVPYDIVEAENNVSEVQIDKLKPNATLNITEAEFENIKITNDAYKLKTDIDFYPIEKSKVTQGPNPDNKFTLGQPLISAPLGNNVPVEYISALNIENLNTEDYSPVNSEMEHAKLADLYNRKADNKLQNILKYQPINAVYTKSGTIPVKMNTIKVNELTKIPYEEAIYSSVYPMNAAEFKTNKNEKVKTANQGAINLDNYYESNIINNELNKPLRVNMKPIPIDLYRNIDKVKPIEVCKEFESPDKFIQYPQLLPVCPKKSYPQILRPIALNSQTPTMASDAVLESINIKDYVDVKPCIPVQPCQPANLKYSGYKTYKLPAFNPCISQEIPKNELKLTPICNIPEIPCQNLPVQSNIDYANYQESPNSIEDKPVSIDNEIKNSLIKYLKGANDKIGADTKEINIPIKTFAIVKPSPCTEQTIKTKNKSLGIKVWKSNIKVVEAEIKLKFKDLSVTNFMPVVDNLNDHDAEEIKNIVKGFINEKYGEHFEVNEPYYHNNEYNVLKGIDNDLKYRNYNILWPAKCVNLQSNANEMGMYKSQTGIEPSPKQQSFYQLSYRGQ